jgi:copper(I)-binding protein
MRKARPRPHDKIIPKDMREIVLLDCGSRVLFGFALMACFLGNGAGAYAQATPPAIVIDQAWARATPPGAKAGAVYLTLRNNGNESDRLLAVEGDIGDHLAVHSHMMADGMAQMRPMDGVDIPAHGQVEFKPGGYHIMVMGLHSPLIAGQHAKATLILQKAGRLPLDAIVRPIGANGIQ